jgi:hypothetical protein
MDQNLIFFGHLYHYYLLPKNEKNPFFSFLGRDGDVDGLDGDVDGLDGDDLDGDDLDGDDLGGDVDGLDGVVGVVFGIGTPASTQSLAAYVVDLPSLVKLPRERFSHSRFKFFKLCCDKLLTSTPPI